MPTAWRCLHELTPAAWPGSRRARARRRVWELVVARHGRLPPSRTCYGDLGEVVAIRLDASIVVVPQRQGERRAHVQEDLRVPPADRLVRQHRRGAGGPAAAGQRRQQHRRRPLEVLTEAIAQIPAKHRRRLLVTLDGAGASHPVVAHLSTLNAAPGRQVHYSIGFDLDGRTRTAIGLLPESAWEPALDAAGAGRADADVAELTGLLRRGPDGDKLTGWPADMRVIVRREPISPGAQISLFEQIKRLTSCGQKHQRECCAYDGYRTANRVKHRRTGTH